jgi:hypothetical protein
MAVEVTREWLLKNGVSEETLESLLQGTAPKVREPGMNVTETRFAAVLDAGRWPQTFDRWAYEPVTLQLTPDMKFTPDFGLYCGEEDSIELIDVKGGHIFEDAIIKGKAAAVLFPQHRFYIAQWKAGEWRVRQLGVKPANRFKISAT